MFFATRRHPGLLKSLKFALDEKLDYLATVIYYLERTQSMSIIVMAMMNNYYALGSPVPFCPPS